MSDRREFIIKSGLACAGGMLGLLSLSACKTIHTVTASEGGKNVLILPLNEFSYLSKGEPKQRNLVIVNHATIPFSIAVYKLEDGTYSALKMMCTHNACDLNATETVLVCPCHGSEFSQTGKVLSAPASVNLAPYRTEVSDNRIKIYL
ncbi:MAG: Rieske (2Fe-2S) protein [Bacteroidia bacterium]|nr:Rieske (2Fe-2S) protein [Bacteroidia bacterium]